MADAAPPSASWFRGFFRARDLGWIGALLAALGFVLWDTMRDVVHYAGVSATYGIAVSAPPVDEASPTGYADGRRTVVYPATSVDAQHWIMQTQRMLARSEWRVREVSDENSPEGRSVHWGSPFRWWLGACALVDSAFSGRSLAQSVEFGALYANPVLLGLLLVGLVPWAARRWGAGAAAFLAIALVGTPPFAVMFAANNPDHHGLIQVCALVCVFALQGGAAGWVRRDAALAAPAWSWLPSLVQARRAFTVSAVAGGLGIWVSAAGTIPVLVGIGVGALWSAWQGRHVPEFARLDANLWRRWGRIGGATTLVAYGLEYFPFDLGWRLEVIHPVYAVAWVGAGELLAQLTAALSQGRLLPVRFAWGRSGFGIAAMLAPVVVIAVGGPRVFAVADPFLWALSHDYVPEGRGLITAAKLAGLTLTTVTSCLPMLALVGIGLWLARRSTPALARAVVAVPFCATAIFWLMALQELRWWVVGYGFLFGVIVMVAKLGATVAWGTTATRTFWLGMVMVFAPGVVDAVRGVRAGRTIDAEGAYSLVERDLAHALRQRVGAGPLVVLGAPATTSRLNYFGGAAGLGTCYWENLEGMKRAAAIFAARTAEEAHALVQAAGVTHLVLLSWDDFAEPYVRLVRNLPPSGAIAEPAFGLELQRASVPPSWLRVLPNPLPDIPPLRGQRVMVFEVTGSTRPEQVLVRRVNHLIYQGQAAAATPLRPELARYADDLAAQVALARLEGVLENAAGFGPALARVERLLSGVSRLEPEDRVNLLILLAYGGRVPEARIQMRSALVALDDAALRQLTPGALMNLLTLADRLECEWPDERKRNLAVSLVRPDRRP